MTEHEATTPELQSAEEQEPAEEEEQPASEHGSPASQKEGASPSPTASVESSTTPAMEREESSSSEIAPMQETTAEDLHNFCSTQVRLEAPDASLTADTEPWTRGAAGSRTPHPHQTDVAAHLLCSRRQ
ncbi:hypothetical protein T484DRAFT_1750146 [Baffinella frigidus]|nr:hypothetical protein T484DRAFT_1750146 [Cryptophyta sp. CCMP2293]